MEVACYNYEGIDAVKNALRAGLEMSTEDMPIKLWNFFFPLYLPVHIKSRFTERLHWELFLF